MRKLLLPFLFVVGTSAAFAQSGEFFFNAGESILSNKGIGSNSLTGSPNDYQLDNGFRFGFRFGFNSDGHIGHEFQYAYSRSHLLLQGVDQGGMAIHTGGYNFLYYATRDGARFRPFVTGGAHFSNFVPPGSSATSGGGSTKFGLNYGAGVKYNLTHMWALRFDVRRYETRKPFDLFLKEGWLHQTEVSAGVGIHF